jgi:tryptophanase
MTIEEILAGFAAGTVTQDAAATQLHALVDQQVNDAIRCNFAQAALIGMLATGVRRPSIAETARECFEYADAMTSEAAKQGATAQP